MLRPSCWKSQLNLWTRSAASESVCRIQHFPPLLNLWPLRTLQVLRFWGQTRGAGSIGLQIKYAHVISHKSAHGGATETACGTQCRLIKFWKHRLPSLSLADDGGWKRRNVKRRMGIRQPVVNLCNITISLFQAECRRASKKHREVLWQMIFPLIPSRASY